MKFLVTTDLCIHMGGALRDIRYSRAPFFYFFLIIIFFTKKNVYKYLDLAHDGSVPFHCASCGLASRPFFYTFLLIYLFVREKQQILNLKFII